MKERSYSEQLAVWPSCLTISPCDIDLGEKDPGTSFTAEFKVNSAQTCKQTYYIQVPKPLEADWIESISITPSSELEINGSVKVIVKGKFPDEDPVTNIEVKATPNGGTQNVPIHGKVIEPPPPPPEPPKLQVSPTGIDIGTGYPGTPFVGAFTISNAGGGELIGHVQSKEAWIEVTPDYFDITSDTMGIIVSGKFPSTNDAFPGTVTVTATNGDIQSVTVNGNIALLTSVEIRGRISVIGNVIDVDGNLVGENGRVIARYGRKGMIIELYNDSTILPLAKFEVEDDGEFVFTRKRTNTNENLSGVYIITPVSPKHYSFHLISRTDTVVDGQRKIVCNFKATNNLLQGIDVSKWQKSFLFVIEQGYASDLDSETVTERLKARFIKQNITLILNDPVEVRKRGMTWMVVDAVDADQKYLIRNEYDAENKLWNINVYREINWKKVLSQNSYIKFTFIKKSDGGSDNVPHEDETFQDNWSGYKTLKQQGANFVCGAYHYFRPAADIELQKEVFIRNLALEPDDLPPVLDVEEAGSDLDQIYDWLDGVATATKRTPIIYTRESRWNYLSGAKRSKIDFSKYPLWVAKYGTDENSPVYSADPRLLPSPWEEQKIGWFFWQYTDKGHVKSISDEVCIEGDIKSVDRDYYNNQIKDLYQFIRESIRVAFNDVPPEFWAKPWIDMAFAQGIMPEFGTYPFRFGPDEPVLRQDAAIFVLKTKYGKDVVPPPATGTVFNDVPIDHPYARWIEKLKADGFASGRSTDPPLYYPAEKLTRAEMAVLTVRLFRGISFSPPKATGTVFQDVPATHWGAGWIEQAHRDDMAAGSLTNPPLYRPEEPVNRAEMAVFLMKTIEKKPGCGAILQPIVRLVSSLFRSFGVSSLKRV